MADEAPGSIREIEWRGIVRTVADVVRRRRPDSRAWNLLDWGAGLGGLVRTARQLGIEADGLDEGYAATVLAAKGLLARPIPELRERYDVVTAIEVVEHLTDPLPVLRAMASCLKPGGFLFITTGNLAKAPTSLDRWQYARIPDVHVTFWSPRAWAGALGRIGLELGPSPDCPGRLAHRAIQGHEGPTEVPPSAGRDAPDVEARGAVRRFQSWGVGIPHRRQTDGDAGQTHGCGGRGRVGGEPVDLAPRNPGGRRLNWRRSGRPEVVIRP